MSEQTTDTIDEAYARLRDTGPEFEGWLSNHGPMAAEAMVRMARPDAVSGWVDGYRTRLEDYPATRWAIDESEWRDLLGDPSRLGDWCAFFSRAVEEEPWDDLLVRWWPRLLPGALASATHGLIRTGHAVRSLRERETPERRAELAQALGYWAARHQTVPGAVAPAGDLEPGAALDGVPRLGAEGGIRARVAQLDGVASWPPALATASPVGPAEAVPAALDQIVDAAVTRYGRWARASPVMLVHAATGPRAIGLVLPSLPRELWLASYDLAWHVAATIGAVYRPTVDDDVRPEGLDEVETTDRAIASGDEHAIKFAEVARESHRRGNPDALSSAALANDLIGES